MKKSIVSIKSWLTDFFKNRFYINNSMKKIILPFFVIFFAQLTQGAEIKIGVTQHDLGKKFTHRYEKGQNIIAEYIFDKDYEFLYALPHIGASINNQGYTSLVYSGLTWRCDFLKIMFVEATFGVAANNGETKIKHKKRRAIGSNIMFRESFSLGVSFGDIHNVSIMIDHTSNANLTPPNPGLTDIAIRYGYNF